MEVVQVQPRDSYLHYIYVPSKGTAIRWSFTTKRNNISFGVYRRRGHAPLPSSSEIIFRAQQQLQQRQLSAGELLSDNASSRRHHDDDESEFSVNGSATAGRPRAKSVASVKLKEQGLDEIVPIQHMNSSSQKIEGTYVVEEPGNYVLVFDNSSGFPDNTFSRNKAKTLTFSVALVDSNVKASLGQQHHDMSGWLLKKKRKKMQGWAKRWFQLSPSGVLSYSTSPNGVTRGSIQIMLATISSNPDQRLIHIDSGTMLYHLKTLTTDDHDKWTSAFRAYRSGGSIEIQSDLPTASGMNEEANQDVVERGIKGAAVLSSNVARLGDNIAVLRALMEQLAHAPASKDLSQKIIALGHQLEKDQKSIQASAQEQQKRWNAVRGGGCTPQNGDLLHDCDNHHRDSLHRSISARSSISEQFFDAEDIILSGGDDDDSFGGGEEGEVTNEDSSDDDDEPEVNGHDEHAGTLDLSIAGDTVRRNRLPSHAVGDVGSALSVFRKNVGKDLSTIAMPVSMNEPLNMLQRACEDLEYCELLDKAATLSNSMERLMHVALFAVSSFASSQYRTGRKPFNPMMTETYENIRPDKGFRFIAEKVSHNPLIIAAHAEAKAYKYWQCTKIKSKFWGKSMEFMTEGAFNVTLTGHDDHFTFNKPSSWMRNMIAGEKYLETAGEMQITNHSTGEYAIVAFKEGTGGGLFGVPSNRNDVIATFFDSSGKKCRRIVGKWSDKLSEEVDMNKRKLSVLWTANPPGIEDYTKYYGFTRFCVELNEITDIERDKLPRTDTRYRPDQRLYENGLADEADEEKQRIEQKQRERRKDFEQKGVQWKPRWFALQEDAHMDPTFIPAADGQPATSGQSFQYTGQYWQARETGQWPSDMFDLW
ncbi:Oxysterol-binding protein-domain-containing protein [Fennellomyces sp. T-0311]|nr:Oxysterol-binding protein-domain-containing protein [Fennellomyces sp. T-0311]